MQFPMTAISWITLWTGIFELDGNGHAVQYEGGYSDYLEAKQKRDTRCGGRKTEGRRG